LRGEPAARAWLRGARQQTGPLAVSAVSVVEVAGGMRSPERREVTRLLASLRIVPVTERIAWRAADLMRTHRRAHGGIGLGDYLIAATVDVEGMDLATLNVRHFPMFPGLTAPFHV
ncbi:MAG: PIN domain-containing protein, partial [Candidatus Dormibacteraeota bacterium]|nr:PIN domain-containing protein [Candidatus Dormibacteraeota bacterium]